MATNPLTPRVNNIETGGTWKIGDVKQSFLTEAEFQAEHDDTWVLCDGRDVIGSDYAILKEGDAVTSHNIPDARGQFLRGKDHGRHLIDGKGNPDGDLDPSTWTDSKLGSHSHRVWGKTSTGASYNDPLNFPASGITGEQTVGNEGWFNQYIESSGGNETAPKNLTCNMFIKINREPSA